MKTSQQHRQGLWAPDEGQESNRKQRGPGSLREGVCTCSESSARAGGGGRLRKWEGPQVGGNSENVQEEGPWQTIPFKAWVYTWAHEGGLENPGPPKSGLFPPFFKGSMKLGKKQWTLV